jgi:hypothetical protein
VGAAQQALNAFWRLRLVRISMPHWLKSTALLSRSIFCSLAVFISKCLCLQPQVQSATVNLATETAVVWAVPEDTAVQDWKLQLGEKLASQLTTCGYKSSHRGKLLRLAKL